MKRKKVVDAAEQKSCFSPNAPTSDKFPYLFWPDDVKQFQMLLEIYNKHRHVFTNTLKHTGHTDTHSHIDTNSFTNTAVEREEMIKG